MADGTGTNTIYAAGDGMEEIYGGSGTNFIYGMGTNDIFEGGGTKNYIYPNYGGNGGLASIEVKDSNNNPTFDGNVNSNGTTYLGDDHEENPADSGYGGTWTFNDLDSGARLGEDATTPLAVYATWNTTSLSLPTGKTSWATNAEYWVYEVTPGGVSTPLGTSYVNQASRPANQSPITNDRNWTRLGVWNVTVGDTLEVFLTDGNTSVSTDELCVGDVMIHAIWPTVSIRATNVTVNSKVRVGECRRLHGLVRRLPGNHSSGGRPGKPCSAATERVDRANLHAGPKRDRKHGRLALRAA